MIQDYPVQRLPRDTLRWTLKDNIRQYIILGVRSTVFVFIV